MIFKDNMIGRIITNDLTGYENGNEIKKQHQIAKHGITHDEFLKRYNEMKEMSD